MVGISTVIDEDAIYDKVYALATESLQGYGLTVYYKDRRHAKTTTEAEYIYLSQSQGAFTKHTLAPHIYSVDVELLCQVNVTHDNIHQGRRISKAIQRHFSIYASSNSLVIKGMDATDAETQQGQRFTVLITMTYTLKVQRDAN